MSKFEFVSKYADAGLPLPSRKTTDSAGYDLVAAEDTIVPSIFNMMDDVLENLTVEVKPDEYISLENLGDITKQANYRPTLVSTGVKCQ